MLAHERIFGSEQPNRWIFFIHGFLGKGQNWRSFARRLVEEKPGLGAVLVDIRLHGESKTVAAPHTIENAALDIVQLKNTFEEPVSGILGHSFGAKVALKYIAMGHKDLNEGFLVDFTPWALKDKASASHTFNILNMMISLKAQHFESRDEFVYVVTQKGLNKATAQWLSMNGKTDASGFHLHFDAVGLKSLLEDYFSQDLMPHLEKANEQNTKFHLILGGLSYLLNNQDRERLNQLALLHPSHITTQIIEEAGHDVHIDCPNQLLNLVSGFC